MSKQSTATVGLIPYPPTPTLDKLKEVAPYSQKVGEFLDWLQGERGLTICESHTHTEACRTQGMSPDEFRSHIDEWIADDKAVWDYNVCSRAFEELTIITRDEYKTGMFKNPQCGFYEGQYFMAQASIEALLHQFFGIDPKKVEAERRTILDHVRKQS